MQKTLTSPFPVNGYFGPAYFCDRKSELDTLNSYLRGKIPVVIIGVRRLGKTGLIKHLFDQKGISGVFVDLQKTTDLLGLINGLAEGIAMAFPESKYKQVWQTIKSFRPSITFDPLSGTPQFSFDLQKQEQVRQTLSGLLALLAKRKEQVVVAFDEFQQIRQYQEPNVEGLLRSEMQRFPELNFIFSGSQTNMLSIMFEEGTQPFFANTAKLYLEKIDTQVYQAFIHEHFKRAGKSIGINLINEVLNWTETHTYYTQFFCNQLYLQSSEKVGQKEVEAVQWQILQSAKYDYFQLRALLSPGQQKLLYAIAQEVDLFNPTSNKILHRYQLGSTRGIMKNLETLVNKQLINRFHTGNGQPFYKLSNVFIMRYINGYL